MLLRHAQPAFVHDSGSQSYGFGTLVEVQVTGSVTRQTSQIAPSLAKAQNINKVNGTGCCRLELHVCDGQH